MAQTRRAFRIASHRSTRVNRILVVAIAAVMFAAPALAEDEQKAWKPKPPMPEKFDWVQLTSGEWLKGELIEMYDDKLEFDSDELDLLKLDWGDVQQLRTPRTMRVGFLRGVTAVGKLFIDGETIRVMGDEDQEFKRSELITIAAGAPKEINFWGGKVMIGFNVREGNTDIVETTFDARFVRRTVKNRINIDYISNYNRTFGEDVANNHRFTMGWNKFVSDRLYVSPVFFEWFKDPFQNISHRETLGAGVGYQLVDTAKSEWKVDGGPAYQRTKYDSVETGTSNPDNTPALVAGTTYDSDITKWLELFFEYRFQITDEEAGKYNHHMVTSFETDITKRLDFDVTFVWDRIEEPRENADFEIPEKDDFRLTVGVTWDW